MTGYGTCCWGHVGHVTIKPCLQAATILFEDSGLAYCDKHASMVQANRDWLVDRVMEKRCGPLTGNSSDTSSSPA